MTLSTACDRVAVPHVLHERDSHMESNVDRICEVVNRRRCSFDNMRTFTRQMLEITTVNPVGDIIEADQTGASNNFVTYLSC